MSALVLLGMVWCIGLAGSVAVCTILAVELIDAADRSAR